MEGWQAYLIATVIGLLVGIEREKAQPGAKSMGVRTFLLLSLLGAIAGGQPESWLTFSLSAFALSAILISYYINSREGDSDQGLTTEIAGALVFALGYVAHSQPVLAILIGPLVALVLFSKPSLHRFTDRVKPAELNAALYLILIAALVWNLMPDKAVDPWEMVNPRKFGLLIVTLAALEFGSYVLAKLLGPERGLVVAGILGGVISSTAVILSTAKRSRHEHGSIHALASSAIAANLSSMAAMLFILALTSTALANAVLFPLLGAMIVGAIPLVILSWREKRGGPTLEMRSPLDWRGVLRLAFLLGLILLVVAAIRNQLGEDATVLVTGLAAIFELHGVTIAAGTMHEGSQLSLETAKLTVYVAVTSSLAAKIAMSWIVARNRFSKILALALGLMMASLWLVIALF